MSGALTGFTINVTYDASVTQQSDAFQAQFKACVNAAIAELEADFTSPITLNITVGFGEVGGRKMNTTDVGQSLTTYSAQSYATVVTALDTHASSADDLTAYATLSGTTQLAGNSFQVATAEAKALGILPANGTAIDGSIGISSYFAMNFDPTNRAVSGEYDAVGTIEHEITETMGRFGYENFDAAGYTPLDLFRYTSAGVRDFTPAFGYFSIDGQTMLGAYNSPLAGGDAADWDPPQHGDAFDDLLYTNNVSLLSTVDQQEMNVIGFARAANASQPGNALPFAQPGGIAYLGFASASLLATAEALLGPVSISLLQGGLTAANATPGLSTSTAEAFAQQGGLYTLGAGTSTFVDAAAAPVTVLGGGAGGQLIVAGAENLAFNAGSGAGTVLAGGGNNLVSIYQGAGDQNVLLDNGDDTVIALGGDNTIAAGTGRNAILLGAGNNQVTSAGTDLIAGGSGAATITSGANSPTIFLGTGASDFVGGTGPATIVAGGGASTIFGAAMTWLGRGPAQVTTTGAATLVGGSGAATIAAVSGTTLAFLGDGPTDFLAGSGAATLLGSAAGAVTITGGTGTLVDAAYGKTVFQGGAGAATIAGLGGSVTVTGGSGAGLYLGGPDGHNQLSGGTASSILFAGGAGDVLAAGNSPGDVLIAAAGAETLTGAGTAGANSFYGGTGPDLIIAGAGQTQIQAGSGPETLVAGAGTDLFAFVNGRATQALVQGFDPARDFVSFQGFSGPAIASTAGASGSAVVTLTDGTSITFAGLAALNAGNVL